jgi:hypothetical protein
MRENTPQFRIVRAAGGLTILFSGCYLFLGGALLFGGAQLTLAPQGGWQFLLNLIAAFLALIVFGLLLVGGATLVVGIGLLKRRRWSRWLAVPLSFLLGGVGLLLFFDSNDSRIGTIVGLVHLVPAGLLVAAACSTSAFERTSPDSPSSKM